MEIIYFTLTAILLYLASDWILRRMETAAGKRFEKRSALHVPWKSSGARGTRSAIPSHLTLLITLCQSE